MAPTAERWWTSPAESESGRLIMVTGRDNINKYRESGKYIFRVEVSWDYDSLPDGMPSAESAATLESVTDALSESLKKEKGVILTGIYTGDGRRDWVFYTKNLRLFSSLFNRSLESLPLIPFAIEAYSDPEWEEYAEMHERTYIPPEEE